MAVGALSTLVLPLARRAQDKNEAIGGGRDFLAGDAAIYGVFECAGGGHVALGALEPHFWKPLCAAMGVAIANGAMFTPAARRQVAAALATRTASEWELALQAVGVPATKVVPPEEAIEGLEALTGTALTVEVPFSDGSVLRLPRLPLSLGTPSPLPGPKLGANNEEFLGVLGLTSSKGPNCAVK